MRALSPPGHPTATARAAMLCLACAAGVALLGVPGTQRRAAADAPIGRYQVAAGEVLDTQTGLVWQQTSSATTMPWADARAHCGGGWRLPSVKELQTLVDETRSQPAMDTAVFTDVSAGSGYDYWSSSAVAGLTPSNWWFVEFAWGCNIYGSEASRGRVRCVR